MNILFHKYTGNIYKQLPFKPKSQYPILILNNGETPYWDIEENNENDKYKDDEFHFINEQNVYIDNMTEQLVISSLDMCYKWIKNLKHNIYKFMIISTPDDYLKNKCHSIKDIVDMTVNIENTINILDFKDKKENNNDNNRKNLDDYVIDLGVKTLLKYEHKLSKESLELLLNHIRECIYF